MSHHRASKTNSNPFDAACCEGPPPRQPQPLRRRQQEPATTASAPRAAPARSASRTRQQAAVVPQRQPLQQQQQQRTTNARLRSEPTSSSVIHKELYTDNPALVEVTVKTHNANNNNNAAAGCRSAGGGGRREPWARLLRNERSAENVSSFSGFDPLRTLHFLAKELQNKLVDTVPNDKSIQQMVVDMQSALVRIPPEVASSVALQLDAPNINPIETKSSNVDIKKHTPFVKDMDEFPMIHFVKPPSFEKSCQTMKTNYVEAERLQKHLEESSAKIETACKQMENVCTRLKSEKEELEIMLRAEKETVRFLRKQMEETETEKAEVTNSKIISLQQERDSLHSQVKKLKAQLDSYAHQEVSHQELSNTVQDLRKQKLTAEEQITVLNHNLTLANMEKEKYVSILAARDKQIKEIRAEMTQLQEVVNEQMLELQNGPSSITSSVTNMATDWFVKSKYSKTEMDNSLSSAQVEDVSLLPMYRDKNAKMLREHLSGDNSELKDSSRKNMNQDKSVGKISDKSDHFQTNIRDMFAEIKRQALLVTPNKSTEEEEEGYHDIQPR